MHFSLEYPESADTSGERKKNVGGGIWKKKMFKR